MLSLPRILLPVDFSGRSAGAATYARGLAARFDSEVLAVHVVDLRIFGFLAFLGQEDADSAAPPESEALAGQALDRFIEQHLGGVRSRRAVLFGDPARQIVRCSEREKSSLIVLPTHGYGPFRQNLLGSVVSKVLHDAACPVWTGVHMENHAVAEPLKIGRI
ncbi:MAG: universal stress protein, partial [Acidobacteria bacterium]|nr:universal stress protein [Acidobacteriota bacterium]